MQGDKASKTRFSKRNSMTLLMLSMMKMRDLSPEPRVEASPEASSGVEALGSRSLPLMTAMIA